jgi:hypothetical protein
MTPFWNELYQVRSNPKVDLTVVDGTVVEVAVGFVDVPAANVAKGVNKSRITFQNSITSYNLILN